MRDTKFRTRLFLCFLAVIVMTLVLPGLYVRKNIKEDGIDETVRNARREAVLIRMQMETAPDGVHGLSSTFDRIGTELGIRITFIGADGTVLAESDSSRINLNDLDNHADRQEIGAALREGFGSASATAIRWIRIWSMRPSPSPPSGSFRTASSGSPCRSST